MQQARAKQLVFEYTKDRLPENTPFNRDDVFIVWFSKTLLNWKSLLGTTLPDDRYFELTYDGNKGRTYVDVYDKVDQVIVPDEMPSDEQQRLFE